MFGVVQALLYLLGREFPMGGDEGLSRAHVVAQWLKGSMEPSFRCCVELMLSVMQMCVPMLTPLGLLVG